MLTQHQRNLVGFFADNAQFFTSYLLASLHTPNVIFVEIEEQLVHWLDLAIKQEMSRYKPNTPGHTRYVDMLIELHARRDEDTKRALMGALAKAFPH